MVCCVGRRPDCGVAAEEVRRLYWPYSWSDAEDEDEEGKAFSLREKLYRTKL